MSEDITFYNAQTIADVLNVSKTTAYRIIKTLNEELNKNGYATVRGRVSKRYFEEKYCV